MKAPQAAWLRGSIWRAPYRGGLPWILPIEPQSERLRIMWSEYAGGDFQPMNVNFGFMEPLDRRIRNKQEKNLAYSQRALQTIDSIIVKEL